MQALILSLLIVFATAAGAYGLYWLARLAWRHEWDRLVRMSEEKSKPK